MLDDRHQLYIQRNIVVCLAGPCAEKEYTGRWNRVGAQRDYEQAADYALRCGSVEEANALLKWSLIRTNRFISTQTVQEQIKAVAEALLERETLSYTEVQEIVRRAFTLLGESDSYTM